MDVESNGANSLTDVANTIRANIGLVYSTMQRFDVIGNQDAESASFEALYKAALTYKPNTTTCFSTYATCVISNAIRTCLRSANKVRQILPVSYDEPIDDMDPSKGTIRDFVTSGESVEDVLLHAELSTMLAKAIDTVRESLSNETHKIIFDLWVESNGEARQRDIADQLKLSQAYVSSTLSCIKYKLRKELEDYYE